MTDSRRANFLLAAGVVALAFAAFLPTLASPRACIDPERTLSIPMIATPRDIPGIFSTDFLFYTEGEYRPAGFAALSFGRVLARPGNLLFWGAWLVAFHAFAAVLVFFIARQLTARAWPAFAAAALFAAHPLASQFAGDAAKFPVVFGAFLTLGALACYLRFMRTRGAGAFLASLALFAVALLSSRAAWALPPILLILELAWQRARPFGAVLRFAAFLLVEIAAEALASSFHPSPVRFVYPPAGMDAGVISFFTFLANAPNFVRGVFIATGIQAPPGEFVNSVYSWTDSRVLIAGTVALVLVVFAVYELARKRGIGVGILLAVACVLPFASIAWHRVSERLSWDPWYLAAPGAALALGALADALAASPRRVVRVGVAAAAAAWVAIFSVMLVRENVARRDAVSYWTRVVDFAPRSEAASRRLGEALFAAGRRDEALDRLFNPSTASIPRACLAAGIGYLGENETLAATVHFLRAERFAEQDAATRNRIAILAARLLTLLDANDYSEASASQALALNPWDAEAMDLVAKALANKGYLRAARRFAERAREIVPDDDEAAGVLATIDAVESSDAEGGPRVLRPAEPARLRFLVGEQRIPELCRMMTALASRIPEDPLIQAEAGLCLLGIGRAAEAREHFEAARAKLPNRPDFWATSGAEQSTSLSTGAPAQRDAEFWNNMGYGLYRRGSTAEAEACFRAALSADPGFAAAHNNLGLALGALGKHNEAIEAFRAATKLAPREPDAWRSLATELLTKRDYATTFRALDDAHKAVPADREIAMRLAMLLAMAPEDSIRDGARAVKVAEEALAGVARRANDVAILAAAYAEAGDFDRAIVAVKEAMALARAERMPGLTDALAERLASYEKKMPVRMN